MVRPISLALAAALAGCASHVAPPSRVPAGDGSGWAYEVLADEGARELGVLATFPPGSAPTLGVVDESARFVSDVELADAAGKSWTKVRPTDGAWHVDACATRGCSVRYRFLLGDAASALDDVDLAAAYDHAIEAPPSTWLLRPTEFSRGTPYRFHVRAADTFATGVRPVEGAPDTYGADVTDLELAPYTVFGAARSRSLVVEGSTIEIATLRGRLALDDAAVDHWVTISARAIAEYYGRFPVKRLLLVVTPSSGDQAGGKTLAGGGATILLDVGRDMKPEDVPKDWVLTHEMTHVSFPTLPRQYRWLEEGLATYVEPIARAHVGTIEPEEVWQGLVDGLPKGEPEPGDRGLDRTHTWGRTYWGGALFCLLADMEIRQRTGNRRSLRDALRGILADGGNGEARWSIERTLEAGDKAVGAPVLAELHARYGTTPVSVDLARVWQRLGVQVNGGSIAFDDRAPEAAIRRGIAGRP
jgi:hypothetical protein